MAKVLTVKAVEQAKPDPRKRLELPDGLLAGLYFVVQPSGAKSWAVRYRHAGDPRKLTLGAYPALDLAQARSEARTALLAAARGEDPAAQKKARRRVTAQDVDRDLVKNVVAEFIERHAKTKRSRPEIERMFRHDVLPLWGERRIQEITRRDVLELLDGLTDRGVGSMTNRVFSIVRKLFNWAISREIVETSPCAGVRPPVREVSRDRVLSDDELRWFWAATGSLGFPFGPLFRLLLITGQRLSEVGEMTVAELNTRDRLWTIPKERVKNASAHDVPLSALALAEIEAIPRVAGRSGYLFTTTGQTPASGFSRAKANLDKAMLAGAREEAREIGTRRCLLKIEDTSIVAPENAVVPAWRLHDLRRTAASGMARLGIHLPVIEKVLNHTSGSFAGIVGVYQRHAFADEKRRALDAWGGVLDQLVTGAPAGNVVALRA